MIIFRLAYLMIGESLLPQLLKLFGATAEVYPYARQYAGANTILDPIFINGVQIPLLIVLPLRFGIMGVLFAGPVADFAAFVLSVVLADRELRKQRMVTAGQ